MAHLGKYNEWKKASSTGIMRERWRKFTGKSNHLTMRIIHVYSSKYKQLISTFSSLLTLEQLNILKERLIF